VKMTKSEHKVLIFMMVGSYFFAGPCAVSAEESRKATQSEKGRCANAQKKLSELDRQIGRLSGRIGATNTERQIVHAATDDIAKAQASCTRACPSASRNAKDDCRGACDKRAQASVKAAESKGSMLKEACRDIQQSLAALMEIRSDLTGACPVDPRERATTIACIQ
jgi:phage shock protein A